METFEQKPQAIDAARRAEWASPARNMLVAGELKRAQSRYGLRCMEVVMDIIEHDLPIMQATDNLGVFNGMEMREMDAFVERIRAMRERYRCPTPATGVEEAPHE